MATVVQGGSTLFDSLAYSKPHPGTQTFLQNQLQQGTHLLTEAGNRFMEQASALYEKVSGSEAMRMARAASRAVKSVWQTNEIQELIQIGQLQHAPPVMQRWIMAEPTIRKLYHQQRCDGYSDTYTDIAPGQIGEEHYDYRRAMNGLVQERDDGSWYANCYYDELLPEDEELLLDEQVDIQTTWLSIVEHLRAGKEDPTSKWNADL